MMRSSGEEQLEFFKIALNRELPQAYPHIKGFEFKKKPLWVSKK
jgi:hypothetical protein